MSYSTPGFPVIHYIPEFAQTHVHWVNDAIQPSHPLLPPSLTLSFPRIRLFSSELVLCIKWPKYGSFSISPSNEYSGLISFRIDWFDLLDVQGMSRVFFSTRVWKHQFFKDPQPSLWSSSHDLAYAKMFTLGFFFFFFFFTISDQGGLAIDALCWTVS